MSDNVLLVGTDGGIRVGERPVSARTTPTSAAPVQAGGSRRVEDVVDLSAGLRAAQALKEAKPEEIKAKLAEGRQAIEDNAARFGALAGRRRGGLVDRVWNAVRAVVSDILSGPHPAKEKGLDVNQRLAAKLKQDGTSEG